MELLLRTAPNVTFDLPTSDTQGITATYSKNGATPVPQSVNTADGVATVTLPYQDSEGRVEVTWTFTIPDSGTFTDTQVYKVVTPILPQSEIKRMLPDFTDEQVRLMESGVRHTIYSVTGQTFGKFVGTYKVKGSASSTLYLPDKLLALDTVNGLDPTGYFTIEAGGYRIRHFPYGIPSVKADYHGLYMESGGVIHNPENVSLTRFFSSATYDITGTWGYWTVPAAVQDAARILVDEYSCIDSEYRDRYLISMTAADWRIQFYEGAFSGTGNARADKLLEPHVKSRRWVAL